MGGRAGPRLTATLSGERRAESSDLTQAPREEGVTGRVSGVGKTQDEQTATWPRAPQSQTVPFDDTQ